MKPIEANDIKNLKLVSTDKRGGWYYEYKMTCEINGEERKLTYMTEKCDSGYDYNIHTEGNDIWDVMSVVELDKVERKCKATIEYSWWVKQIEIASSINEIMEVWNGLCEKEETYLDKEQMQSVKDTADARFKAIRKEISEK